MPVPSARDFDDLDELVQRLSASTVKVRAGSGGNGSGLIVGADGQIVTNAHVAFRRSMDVELPDGSTAPGEIVARDPARDLAILSTPVTGRPPLVLADSDALRPGEIVISIGNPFGSGQSVALGVVHAVQARDRPWRMVVADIRLAPGYSGGPMVNARGELIGVNTMISGGLGLAVPSNHVRTFLTMQKRPKLGIVVRPVRMSGLPAGEQRDGLLVTEVAEGMPAARGGLFVGDVIVAVDGATMRFPTDLTDAMAGAGTQLRVEVIRGGRRRELLVTLVPPAPMESMEAA
jgi:serine protease Do